MDQKAKTPGGSAVSKETSQALCMRNPEVAPLETLASIKVNHTRGAPVKAGAVQRE
jgi:hypothetical protein